MNSSVRRIIGDLTGNPQNSIGKLPRRHYSTNDFRILLSTIPRDLLYTNQRPTSEAQENAGVLILRTSCNAGRIFNGHLHCRSHRGRG